MKLKIVFVLLCLVSACRGTKKRMSGSGSIKQKNSEKKELHKTIVLEQGCPSKGNCSLQLIKNKGIVFKTDEATGRIYPEFELKPKTDVVQLIYTKNQDQAYVDGQYREEVYFELPTTTANNSWRDGDLQKLHFVFGRFCFCRGSAGYYKVSHGKVEIKAGELRFTFEKGKVPQILQKIKAHF